MMTMTTKSSSKVKPRCRIVEEAMGARKMKDNFILLVRSTQWRCCRPGHGGIVVKSRRVGTRECGEKVEQFQSFDRGQNDWSAARVGALIGFEVHRFFERTD